MRRKIIALLLILVGSLLVGCSNTEVGTSNYEYNYGEYEDYSYSLGEKTFSFKYPENWMVEDQPAWEASEGVEASPEWGVKVFLKGDEENYILIFGSYSANGYVEEDDYTKKEFKVGDFNKGDVYTKKADGRVDMYVLYDKKEAEGFHNAIVNVTEEFYNLHKDEIWHILGSVEY